ncbi:MAG: iron-sulfur cluster assembly scaffold protein [Candidatus Niyogibacteria bacterium]|nr:iron-sulfur cluster assembly scaffold protein [Candidatus Niyogibacteria bacterium]
MKTKTKKNKKRDVNVVNSKTGETWYYSDTVKDHFFHPQNILLKEPKVNEYDADGMVGSPACGDMMRMWIIVDSKTERVKKL